MADFLNLNRYNWGFGIQLKKHSATGTLSPRYWVIVIVKLCLSGIFTPAVGLVLESHKNGRFLEQKET